MKNAHERHIVEEQKRAANEDDSKELEAIWEALEELTKLSAANRDKVLAEGVIARADALVASSSDKTLPDSLYALGYSLYFHPERETRLDIQTRTESVLLRLTTLEPSNARAWLYLGHSAYDLGNFEAASVPFEKATSLSLPPYLHLKALEFSLCCQLRTRPAEETIRQLVAFVELATQYPMEDIWPHNLALTLKEHLPDFDTQETRASFEESLRRLDRAGRFDWFSELLD